MAIKIKFKPFIKSDRIFKKQLKWLLLAAICAICVIKSPVVAQLSNTSNLLTNAQNFQIAGNYRRACGNLLQSIALPPQECRKLIRDEVSPQLTETLTKLPETQLNATILRNLGDLLRVVGAIQNSEIILNQSLTISRKLNSNSDISATLVSLGNTKRALGKREENYNYPTKSKIAYQAALKYYQDAININAEPFTNLRAKLNQLNLSIENNVNLKLDTDNLPTQIEFELNQFPATRETIYAKMDLARSLTCLKLKQIDSIRIKSEYIPPIARTCTNSDKQLKIQQADIYSWQKIGQLLAKSVQQSKALNDARSQSYALGQLGELYEITQQWSSAKELTEQALRLAQSIHAWDIAYRWQWQLGRIEINQENDVENAIKNYNAAFETLQALRQDLTALNPDIQFNFRDEVEPVYRDLVELLLRNKPGENEISQENLEKARKVIEALQLAELNNFFREACLNASPKQIDQIDRNAAVIYPIILKNRLDVILSIAGKPLLHNAIALPDTQINDTVKEFRESLTTPGTNIGKLKTQSKQLYDWLLKPFEDELEMSESTEKSNIKTLVFVLDGSLRNIPMASLYTGEKYLIERYAIALTPGLQLLDPKTLSREQINALLGGAKNAPSFQKETLGSIENVEIELDLISKEIPSRKLTEAKFNPTNIQNQINSSDFSIVHLATHGKFSSNPDETFILVWNDRIKVKDLDRLLRHKDQPQSNPIELLVLSACQTAQGDNRAALGLAGVAVRAGARSTLATLWQVNDASTAELMALFYQHLKKPQLTKAEALRQAQLALLHNEENDLYQNPYFWSPFIIIGNWF